MVTRTALSLSRLYGAGAVPGDFCWLADDCHHGAWRVMGSLETAIHRVAQALLAWVIPPLKAGLVHGVGKAQSCASGLAKQSDPPASDVPKACSHFPKHKSGTGLA